jgi:hypothetical protein
MSVKDDFQNLLLNFADDLESSLQEQTDDEICNIITFIDKEIDLGIKLTQQQRLVLKLTYGLELDTNDISILEYWHISDKINVCPKSLDTLTEPVMIAIEAGRRSGKTTLASIICAYEFYRLCKLKNPQEYYNISNSTPISILIVATTAQQAKSTVFKSIVGILKNCKYFAYLESKNLLFIGKKEIVYDEKQINIISGNSKSGGQVGLTIKCLVMDEVARFKSADGLNNALVLWSNLGIACAPFKNDHKRIAISSAWEEEDAIYQLVNRLKLDKNALTLTCKSWDLNPVHASRDNLLVASEYISDPIAAACEFEGIRPTTHNAFLSAIEVDRAVRGESCIQSTSYIENDLACISIDDITYGQPNELNCLHLDPAIKKDGYALAFGHAESVSGKQMIVIDGMLVWQPSINSEVSFSDVSDAITKIHKYRNLTKVTADHYNSTETIQRLRRSGINSAVVHFSNQHQLKIYDYLRRLLHEDRLILPKNSPWTPLIIRELKSVQLINHTKIDHPVNSSKDLADCVASVAFSLSNYININCSNRFRVEPSVSGASIPTNTYSPIEYKHTSKKRVLSSIRNYRKAWIRNELN